MAGAFPIPKYHFKVEMEGFRETSFKEVTGLSQEYDKMEYRGGGRPITSTSKRLVMCLNAPAVGKIFMTWKT